MDFEKLTPVSERAASALIKNQSKQSKADDSQKLSIIEDDPSKAAIWLVCGLDKVKDTHPGVPLKISIPHPFRLASDKSLRVCVICKDPSNDLKSKLEDAPIPSVEKVIGVSKLKTKYKSYEAKRQLCDSFDLFLADERVLSLLPPILGKYFFQKKKIPLPVDLSSPKVEAIVDSLSATIQSTVYYKTTGPCASVKVGIVGQEPAQIAGNINAVIKHLESKKYDFRTLSLKTNSSISLPIYSVSVAKN